MLLAFLDPRDGILDLGSLTSMEDDGSISLKIVEANGQICSSMDFEVDELIQPRTEDIALNYFVALQNFSPDVVLLPDGPQSRQVAAILAVKLSGTLLCGLTRINMSGALMTVRLMAYGGKAEAQIQVESRPVIATIRGYQRAKTETIEEPHILPTSQVLRHPWIYSQPKYEVISKTSRSLSGIDEARIIISGGRGLNSADIFRELMTLAEELGATAGASLAAVEAGWATPDIQIGQTGHSVTPDVYIAVGISGATQHIAGIAGTKHVIAVNKDSKAPIFAVADLGIVADAGEFIHAFRESIHESHS